MNGKARFDPHAFLAKVGHGQTVADFAAGSVVYSQGAPADAIFYLESGQAKAAVLSEEGKEAVVALLGPEDFFGEGCLAGQPSRMATVTTMTPCRIGRLEKADVVNVIREEPSFAELFIAHLLARNIRVEEDLIDQLFNSSEKRLARVLLLLANFGKEEAPQPVLAKISQEMLAEMIGTTRARVSFFMNKFRKLGLISYNGRIEVFPSLLNVVLHERRKVRKRTDPT